MSTTFNITRETPIMSNSHEGIVKVFMIDDEEDHLVLLGSMLTGPAVGERVPTKFELQTFSDPTLALATLPAEGPVVIVCDYEMPGGTALDWLPDLIKRDIGPVVLITGHGDEKIAAKAFIGGASDYLIKSHVMDHPEVLRHAVREAMRRYMLEKQEQLLARLLHRSNVELETKNNNLRQLSYSMTHDLQTPLAGLNGAIDALKQHLAPQADETTNRWMSRVEDSANRMVAMLDDLMIFAKAGSETLECSPVNLGDVLKAVVDQLTPLASARNIDIRLADISFIVVAEPNTLQRVFTNLIGNAIKFIERKSGGLIRIEAERRDNAARISIIDNGPGVAANQLERVFLPFKRASIDKPGTGLGLSIARQYINAFGGQVWLESDGATCTAAIIELQLAVGTRKSHSPFAAKEGANTA